MQSASFNLVNTASVLQRRWKTIALFVVVCTLAASLTVFLVPRYYRSSATVVAGNALLADRNRLVNNQIKDLYSYFGSGDDLDRIIALAERDITYYELVDSFSLISYYHLGNDSLQVLRKKALLCVKKDISLRKTEEGQLQVVAWTKDKYLSAALVNRMVAIVDKAATKIWRDIYLSQLDKLNNNIAQLKQEYLQVADSAAVSRSPFSEMRMQQIQERIQHFSRIADEFDLALQSVPAVLYVTEPALPAAFAERPDKPAVICAAALLALVFACMVVLINDRKAKV